MSDSPVKGQGPRSQSSTGRIEVDDDEAIPVRRLGCVRDSCRRDRSDATGNQSLPSGSTLQPCSESGRSGRRDSEGRACPIGLRGGFEPRHRSPIREGNLDRLPGFAAELVGMGVDVIAAYGGPPTRAARGAGTSIPIVANLVADPVALGYAATLERPGGNVTGITNHDPGLALLQLTILREVFPALERVAFLSDADIPGADSTGFAPIERSNIAAAATMKITPQVLKLRGPERRLRRRVQRHGGAEGAGARRARSARPVRQSNADCSNGGRPPDPDDVLGSVPRPLVE